MKLALVLAAFVLALYVLRPLRSSSKSDDCPAGGGGGADGADGGEICA